MGGFGCLVMAAALRADRYVLVSPHLPPKRCLRLDALGSWNESEEQAKQSGWDGNTTICYDPMIERDSHDVALIKSMVEISSTIAMPFGGHPATNRLASENGLPEFRNEVFSQAPDVRKIQRLHQYAIRATTFPTHYSCQDNGKEVTDNIACLSG